MLKLIVLLLSTLQQVAAPQPCPAGLKEFVNNLGPYCFNHLRPQGYEFINGTPHFSECFHLLDTRFAVVMDVELMKKVTEAKPYEKAKFPGNFYIIVHQLEAAEVIEQTVFSSTTIEFVLIWIGRLECPGLQYRNGILRIIEGNLKKYGASEVFSNITSNNPNYTMLRSVKMEIVKKYDLGEIGYLTDFKILERFKVRFKVRREDKDDHWPLEIVYSGISASFRNEKKNSKDHTEYIGAFVRQSEKIYSYDNSYRTVDYTHVWNHVPYATDQLSGTVPPVAVVVKWLGISTAPRNTLNVNAIQSQMTQRNIPSFELVKYGIRSVSTVIDFLIGKASRESGDFYFDAVVIHTEDIFAQIGEFQKDTKTCSLKKAYANANFAANNFVSWKRDVEVDKMLGDFKPKVKVLVEAELKLLHEAGLHVALAEVTKVTIGFPGYNGHFGNYAVNGKLIEKIEGQADIEILHVLVGTVDNFELIRCKQHFLILYNSKTCEVLQVGHFADTLNESLLRRKHDMFTAITSYASSSEPTTVPFSEQTCDMQSDYKYRGPKK